jgi:hypothetical protein
MALSVGEKLALGSVGGSLAYVQDDDLRQFCGLVQSVECERMGLMATAGSRELQDSALAYLRNANADDLARNAEHIGRPEAVEEFVRQETETYRNLMDEADRDIEQMRAELDDAAKHLHLANEEQTSLMQCLDSIQGARSEPANKKVRALAAATIGAVGLLAAYQLLRKKGDTKPEASEPDIPPVAEAEAEAKHEAESPKEELQTEAKGAPTKHESESPKEELQTEAKGAPTKHESESPKEELQTEAEGTPTSAETSSEKESKPAVTRQERELAEKLAAKEVTKAQLTREIKAMEAEKRARPRQIFTTKERTTIEAKQERLKKVIKELEKLSAAKQKLGY